jgi:hypothetical protein
MVRVNVVVAVVLPLVPLMVMVNVPAAAVLDTLICMAAVPEPPVMLEGLKFTFTPVGCPEAVRAIVPVKPPEGVAVIFALAWPPGATLAFLGNAARVKLPVDDPTVTLAAAEGMPFAITNNELAPVSIPVGTSKFVDTIVLPVATPIVLCPWVLAKKTCPVPVFTIWTSG